MCVCVRVESNWSSDVSVKKTIIGHLLDVTRTFTCICVCICRSQMNEGVQHGSLSFFLSSCLFCDWLTSFVAPKRWHTVRECECVWVHCFWSSLNTVNSVKRASCHGIVQSNARWCRFRYYDCQFFTLPCVFPTHSLNKRVAQIAPFLSSFLRVYSVIENDEKKNFFGKKKKLFLMLFSTVY